MTANRNNTLALRKHTIRTLSANELRVAKGGYGGGGAGHA